ncbi:MAG: voltage-gated potassium channel [Candidatus Omnitrophota bacterium]|jgi:voltage-gated potassium channel
MSKITNSWKDKVRTAIFGIDTPAGKAFDVCLLWLILISVAAVVLESVEAIEVGYGRLLHIVEWTCTILFTIEYVLRIFCVKRPLTYVFSFFGIVDFISIIPSYLALFFVGAQSFLVIRGLRLLRIFRVLKLARFLKAALGLKKALINSRHKIVVFLWGVMTIVLLVGSAMYFIEGSESGFTSIPRSIYWAIVTLTTVGYGDITPQTILGQVLASFIMIIGYGMLAVPTGIVGMEYLMVNVTENDSVRCVQCTNIGLGENSKFCRFCGVTIERTKRLNT